jgi:hypothetical protein
MRTLPCLLLVLLSGLANADADAERACTRLVMDYAVYRDAGNAEAYADLFTENGSLSLLGQTFNGRTAILERMRSAPPQISMHLMSTVRIYPESATRARGVSYAEVYVEGAGEAPSKTDGFLAIGRYHDRFEKTEAGWKIAERRFERVLVRDLPAGG